jgi:hypothetical protein
VEPAVSLRWLGADEGSGCLGQRGLERAVSESLGRDAFSSTGARREIVVSVEPREGVGFRALIRVRDRGGALLGERELVSEGPNCSALDEPLAFTVALMLEEQPAPAEAPPEVQPEPLAREEPPAKPARSERRLSLEAGLLGALGALPGPSLGLDLAAEVRAFHWLGLRLHAAGLLPRTRALGAADARFTLAFAGLAACPGGRSGRLGYAACLGLEAGALWADTQGFESDEGSRRRFLGGSAVLRGRFHVNDRLALGSTAGVLVPHERERFVYRSDSETRTIFEMSAVCLQIGLGASLWL